MKVNVRSWGEQRSFKLTSEDRDDPAGTSPVAQVSGAKCIPSHAYFNLLVFASLSMI